MNIREFLIDLYKQADARHRAAAGVTLDFIGNQWSRQLTKVQAGEAVSVYWFTIRQFLTQHQQAQGGRWIVQEDGSLLKDL